MTSLALAGRILFALPLIGFGINHFRYGDGMGALVPSWVPGGSVWVFITGGALILGGLAIITGVMGRVASLLVALLLLMFVLTIHLPGWMAGGEMAGMSQMSLYKDLAMAGGALVISTLFAPRNVSRS